MRRLVRYDAPRHASIVSPARWIRAILSGEGTEHCDSTGLAASTAKASMSRVRAKPEAIEGQGDLGL